MNFSALNADFSCSTSDLLCSRKSAHASDKEGYSLKSSYFADIGSFSVKTVADGHRYTVYYNKRSWRNF